MREALGKDIWTLDGPVVRAYGFPFPTRMVVVRLSGGGLWLWSPVALDGPVREAIASLGEPRYAVKPNKLHHLALAGWVAAWPSLRLYAPPGLADKRRDLQFAAELTDEAPPEWRDEIEQVRIEGNVGGTPRDARWSFVHRRRAREAVSRVLAWAPERLVIAHGACSMANGTEALRRSFSWLL